MRCLDKGLVDEAILAYRQVLRLRPDYAKVYNNLGRRYAIRGNLKTRVQPAFRPLRSSPTLPRPTTILA